MPAGQAAIKGFSSVTLVGQSGADLPVDRAGVYSTNKLSRIVHSEDSVQDDN
jgi:hypothetical protein